MRSISLIRAASVSLKLATILSKKAFACVENGGTSVMSAVEANFCNQRTSTATRNFINPNSLKIARNGVTLS